MAPGTYELKPATFVTVGTIGRPGQRTFFLQAGDGDQLLSLKLEKEQVSALAEGIDKIIEELRQREIMAAPTVESLDLPDLDLADAAEHSLVVVQLGLGFDESSHMMLLVAEGIGLENEDEANVRVWVTPAMMHALSERARSVVAQGRPICPLCNQPMDPEGHFCPRGNGHNTVGKG